jgi:hypothetical protein
MPMRSRVWIAYLCVWLVSHTCLLSPSAETNAGATVSAQGFGRPLPSPPDTALGATASAQGHKALHPPLKPRRERDSRQQAHKYDIVGTYCSTGVGVHGVTAEGGKSDDHARSLGDMPVRAVPHVPARL